MMKFHAVVLAVVLLTVFLPFGSFYPAPQKGGGLLNEIEFDAQLESNRNSLELKVEDLIARSRADTTARDKSSENGEFSRETHPAMEKREPFNFGGYSRGKKRVSSFPSEREKRPLNEKREPLNFGSISRGKKRESSLSGDTHSRIDKREPFNFGGYSQGRKRDSSKKTIKKNLVPEADETFKESLMSTQDSESLENRAKYFEDRDTEQSFEDLVMELKKHDYDDHDSEMLKKVDENMSESPDKKSNTGNRIPVPGFLETIKGFDPSLRHQMKEKEEKLTNQDTESIFDL